MTKVGIIHRLPIMVIMWITSSHSFSLVRQARSVTNRRATTSLQQGVGVAKTLYSSLWVEGCQRTASTRLFSSTTDSTDKENQVTGIPEQPVSLYQCEGIFAVEKPLDWTSSDVVSYIRGILERDARKRGAKPARVGSRGKKKKRVVKVGHGGTLDPLATGVLVIGVGQGTRELQSFLQGSKGYRAVGELGFETTTLDTEGNTTETASYDHVTMKSIEQIIPQFSGKIMQVPPLYSALKKGGKKLYELARSGASAEDVKIDAREVEIHRLELLENNQLELPKFEINMECGGGTFVRSLIRDMGIELGTRATTLSIQRTKQGPFGLDECLPKADWNAENIYSELEKRSHDRKQDN